MIELKNINKIYKVGKEDFYALRDVSLKIDEGEFVAIRGTSGSGKTTLLNIIGCMDNATSGSYKLSGTDINSLGDEGKSTIRNQKVGFVLQDFALISDQSVLYNVMLPLLLGKTPYRKIKSMAMDALNAVGLANQAKKKVNQLSGGQQQRVAIARAIVTKPEIVLADEPTGQLDSETSRQIMEILEKLNSEGITVLVVTHDAEVAAYAKRCLFVTDGRVSEAV